MGCGRWCAVSLQNPFENWLYPYPIPVAVEPPTPFQHSSTFAFHRVLVYNRNHQDENHSAESFDGSIRGLDNLNNEGVQFVWLGKGKHRPDQILSSILIYDYQYPPISSSFSPDNSAMFSDDRLSLAVPSEALIKSPTPFRRRFILLLFILILLNPKGKQPNAKPQCLSTIW